MSSKFQRTGSTKTKAVNMFDNRVREGKGRVLIQTLMVIFIFFIVSVCVVGKDCVYSEPDLLKRMASK